MRRAQEFGRGGRSSGRSGGGSGRKSSARSDSATRGSHPRSKQSPSGPRHSRSPSPRRYYPNPRDNSPPPPPPVHFACRVAPNSRSGGSGSGAALEGLAAASVVTLTDDSLVYCPEPSLDHILSFQFDAAYGESLTTRDLYEESVLPLVQTVAKGSNACCVVVSEDTAAKSLMTEGRPAHYVYGLVSMVADSLFTLLASRGDASEWRTVVRVSWLQIKDDSLVDLLASTGGESRSDSLVMREDPQLGVSVPGIWEVEITSAADVGEIVRSVRRDSYVPDPECHTVFTFGVYQTPLFSYPPSAGRSPRPRRTPHSRAVCFSLVSLAGLTVPKSLGHSSNTKQSWARTLQRVVKAMRDRSPATPFHRSRACLFLRDALLGRQHASVIAVVSPSIDDTVASGTLLKFVSNIRETVRQFEGIDSSCRVMPSGLEQGEAINPVFPRRMHPSVAGVGSYSTSTVGSPRRAARLSDQAVSDDLFTGSPDTPTSRSRSPSPAFHDAPTASAPVRYTPSMSGASSKGVGNAWMAKAQRPPRKSGGSSSEEEGAEVARQRREVYLAGGEDDDGDGDGDGDGSDERRGRGGWETEKGSDHLRAVADMNNEDGRRGGEDDGEGHGDGHGGGRGADESLGAGLPSTNNPLLKAESFAARMEELSAKGDESAQWFTAMFKALEESRTESRGLRARVEALERESSQLAMERDDLRRRLADAATAVPKQTADAAASLVRELRARATAAEQEVKDYELYKEVMETAICRMQDEMKALAKERDTSKKALRSAHAATRREREDVLATKRRIAELELELQACNEEAEQREANHDQELAEARRQANAMARHHEESLGTLRDEAQGDTSRLRTQMALLRNENEELKRQLLSFGVSVDAESRPRSASARPPRPNASSAAGSASAGTPSHSHPHSAALRAGVPAGSFSSHAGIASNGRRASDGADVGDSMRGVGSSSPSSDSAMLTSLAHGVARDVTDLVASTKDSGVASQVHPAGGDPPRRHSSSDSGRRALIAGLKREMSSSGSHSTGGVQDGARGRGRGRGGAAARMRGGLRQGR